MTNTNIGKKLLWVARRGGGPSDWAIYTHWQEMGIDYVLSNGDKVRDRENVKKLVPCTKEALDEYRF